MFLPSYAFNLTLVSGAKKDSFLSKKPLKTFTTRKLGPVLPRSVPSGSCLHLARPQPGTADFSGNLNNWNMTIPPGDSININNMGVSITGGTQE